MLDVEQAVPGVGIDARQLLESVHDSVLIFDPDGEIVLDVNERACETYGFSRDAFIGMSLLRISSDCERGEQHVRATLQSPSCHAFTTVQRRSDGSELFLNVRARPLEWSGRRVILSINRDITDRKWAANHLVAATEDWQLTVNALHAAVVLVDAKGLVIRANASAEKAALAASLPRLVGRRLADLAHRQPWDRVAELTETAIANRKPMSVEITDLAEGRTWEIGIALPSRPDRRSQATVIVRDISQHRALEESLRRNENMAAVGRLVTGVAHEVRNPLFIISASLDALRSRLPEVDETSQQLRQNLRHELHRLTALMNDLLDYAKPPALNAVVDSLYDVIDDAIATAEMHGSAKMETVRIVNAFPLGTGRVLMDRLRLTQAFRNVIDNALHYSPPGGEVVIRGETVECAGRGSIVCTIEDSGPGFAAGELASVFEPFFSKRPGGTGLGLSIVQRTIELHGGAIKAENRNSGGARMIIELPRFA